LNVASKTAWHFPRLALAELGLSNKVVASFLDSRHFFYDRTVIKYRQSTQTPVDLDKQPLQEMRA
jgi:hypothetical protein